MAHPEVLCHTQKVVSKQGHLNMKYSNKTTHEKIPLSRLVCKFSKQLRTGHGPEELANTDKIWQIIIGWCFPHIQHDARAKKKLAELPRQQLMCACGPIQEQPVDRALVTTGKPTHRCILIKRGDVGFQMFLGHVWVDFERKWAQSLFLRLLKSSRMPFLANMF